MEKWGASCKPSHQRIQPATTQHRNHNPLHTESPTLNLHGGVTANARRDPALRQPPQQRRRPAPANTQHTLGIRQSPTAVKPLRWLPTQGITRARAFARNHLPERTRLGQATHATPVAWHAERGLGRRFRVNKNDLIARHRVLRLGRVQAQAPYRCACPSAPPHRAVPPPRSARHPSRLRGPDR